MSLRVQWRRELRQGLGRLERLYMARHVDIGQSLYAAHCNRLLRSKRILGAVLADIVGVDLSDDEIMIHADSIDLFTPYGQEVRWYRHQKPSGGFRTICVPELGLKVRQRLITSLIVAQKSPDPQIFNWKERGCYRQARQIKDAIAGSGSYVVIADVRNAFPTVDFDAVYDLDLLPHEVIRNASDYRHLNFANQPDPRINSNNVDHTVHLGVCEEQTGPRGLLQGLSSSDALWVSLISDLPERLSIHGLPFIYCDNIAVVCPTDDAAVAAHEALVRYFSDHRAGSFSLASEIHDARNGFEHTGYIFSQCRGTGDVMIHPSVANHIKLCMRLHHQLCIAVRQEITPEMADALFTKALSGISAVTEDFREELYSQFTGEIEARRPNLNVPSSAKATHAGS